MTLANLSGAGADTTSIAMRACLHDICSHPDVYQKLQNEIDAFYKDNNLATPISYVQTQQLPYLNAVTKEAMRLLPSITFQLPRHTPEGGLTVQGTFIPPGTTVGMSPIAQNRDPQVWGDDADEFRPQRWLESEDCTRYLDANNMTFGGSGPRMCVGKNIALAEAPLPLPHYSHADGSNRSRSINSWPNCCGILTWRLRIRKDRGASLLIGLRTSMTSTCGFVLGSSTRCFPRKGPRPGHLCKIERAPASDKLDQHGCGCDELEQLRHLSRLDRNSLHCPTSIMCPTQEHLRIPSK